MPSVVRSSTSRHVSGCDFERLVFATLQRIRAWLSLNWYGQAGADEMCECSCKRSQCVGNFCGTGPLDNASYLGMR